MAWWGDTTIDLPPDSVYDARAAVIFSNGPTSALISARYVSQRDARRSEGHRDLHNGKTLMRTGPTASKVTA
jgi:hypothetical protein